MTVCREFFLGLALTLAVSLPATLHAAPRKPAADSEVLERLPNRMRDAGTRALADLRQAAAAEPASAEAAARLARAYFSLAVARGDPRYVGYADAVVARFRERPTASILLVRGMLWQYRHDFQAALADFSAALAIDPDLAETHSWRAAIHLVEANYAAAQNECDALARLARKTLAGGCRGLLQAYTGHFADARRALQDALEYATDADNRLWLLTRIAEVAGWQGQSAVAERNYRQALALGRDDAYLMTAWADFLLDAGRYEDAARELAGREASDGLLLRLAEAEAKLGRPTLPARLKALEDRFAAARLRGDTTHLGDEARYRLRLRQDAREALRLAAENYRMQREPRDAIVLLEAAIAAGDAAAAAPVRDWLQASGFEATALHRLAEDSAKAGGK